MENNDPYEELEIYLKQINVSVHTIAEPFAFGLFVHQKWKKKFLSLNFFFFCFHANWSPFLPIAHNNA